VHRDWILEQNYSLYDTYGDEFGDLIADIPDPTTLPLAILQDFLQILDELGTRTGLFFVGHFAGFSSKILRSLYYR
jgi:hypothetical protein